MCAAGPHQPQPLPPHLSFSTGCCPRGCLGALCKWHSLNKEMTNQNLNLLSIMDGTPWCLAMHAILLHASCNKPIGFQCRNHALNTSLSGACITNKQLRQHLQTCQTRAVAHSSLPVRPAKLARAALQLGVLSAAAPLEKQNRWTPTLFPAQHSQGGLGLPTRAAP